MRPWHASMSMKVGGLNGRRQMASGTDSPLNAHLQHFCSFVTIIGFFDCYSPLRLWGKLLGASRGNGRRARDQVVTLQDNVVNLLAPEVRSAFHGEKVWLHSRNVPVAEIVAWLEHQIGHKCASHAVPKPFCSFQSHSVLLLATMFSSFLLLYAQEERLLEKAQQPPFCKYIRIHKAQSSSNEQAHATWLESLDADVVVAADGAGSMCRRAFRHAFISPNTEGANTEAQQIRLGETTDDFEEADFALGIALKPDARPPQSQGMNVVLTLAQNVYLLNSQEGSRGFLNIRITKEEYVEIFNATGQIGCTFGSPIRLFKEEDLHLITDALSLIYCTFTQYICCCGAFVFCLQTGLKPLFFLRQFHLFTKPDSNHLFCVCVNRICSSRTVSQMKLQ